MRHLFKFPRIVSPLHPRSLGTLAFLTALGGSVSIHAESTINETDKYGYGANIGWVNFRPSTSDGAAVGEFVCSGFVYAANVGWINLGDGTPANGVQYQNNSATDFGVNLTGHQVVGDTCDAKLRGFAYGANIGWINFEDTGDPRIDLMTGQFKGYAYSANCGWINLGEGTLSPVRTDHIDPGSDTDGDGIADGYELTHQPNLAVMNETTDTDLDGIRDLDEGLADTDPNDYTDGFWIISVTGDGKNSPSQVTFASRPTRKYVIEQAGDVSGPYLDSGLGLFAPDAGDSTSRQVPASSDERQFYKVGVQRPLSP